ncbi:MAG: ATP-binding cassette domain-containing protein, partial [Methanosarcinales archaeon]|nr:ATP-binding cassette domain-containing protein [Methanosarcinales archaeon]
MIRTIDLNKIFGLGETEIKALTDINIDIKKGDFVSIQGPSGCGKSTLLNMLGCLDRPTNGGVFIEGKDVTKLGDNSLAKIRRDKIGFVFQKYNLIPTLNAIENVKLPMMFSGINMAVRTEKAKSLLELV